MKKDSLGTSLAVQWLRLLMLAARGMCLIPDQELRYHMPCGIAKIFLIKKKFFFFKEKGQFPSICKFPTWLGVWLGKGERTGFLLGMLSSLDLRCFQLVTGLMADGMNFRL